MMSRAPLNPARPLETSATSCEWLHKHLRTTHSMLHVRSFTRLADHAVSSCIRVAKHIRSSCMRIAKHARSLMLVASCA